MKKLALLFLLLFSAISFSQLSNKHWIPPLHSRDVTAISDQYIYQNTSIQSTQWPIDLPGLQTLSIEN